MSEQRPLHPQRLRIDRLLAEEALHLAGAGGAVAGEVVVEEAVDFLRMRGALSTSDQARISSERSNCKCE